MSVEGWLSRLWIPPETITNLELQAGPQIEDVKSDTPQPPVRIASAPLTSLKKSL
jgi:hypothetical protein